VGADGWDAMSRTLVQKRNVRAEELVEAGIASPARSASRGVGVIDKFRGRVLFPIRDQNGAATGMGGRILGAEGEGGRDTGPKYLNTPGTPLFDKSRSLYLIDKAKGSMRKSGQAVIVEGYTDALMAHQAGFDNVVASLGTALTPGQVALLTAYAKRSRARLRRRPGGQKAGHVRRAGAAALIGQLAATESGIELDEVRVVRLPDGKDPDEVLRDDAGSLARGGAHRAAHRRVPRRHLREDLRPQDARRQGPLRRRAHADHPRRPEPVMRDAYLQLVHRVSGRGGARAPRRAPRGTASGERRVSPTRHGHGTGRGARVAGSAADGGSRISAEAIVAAADSLPVGEILRGVMPQEAELLRLILLVPEIQLRAVDALGPDQLPSTVARELFRAVVLAREPNDEGVHPPFSLTALVQGLDPETAALAQAVIARRDPNPRELSEPELAYELERLTIDLEERSLDERADYIASALAEAEQSADRESIDQLLRESQLMNEKTQVAPPATRPDPTSVAPATRARLTPAN
jgi:hypothetical protein